VPPQAFQPSPPHEGITHPIARFFYRLLLWLPNEQAPGLGSLCIAWLRQIILPFALFGVPFITLGVVSAKSHTQLNMSVVPSWASTVTVCLLFFNIALVQELSRYSFGRRAHNPTLSVSLFTGVAIACKAIIYFRSPYALAWMIGAQILAGAAMVLALRHRKTLYLNIFAIILCQTVIALGGPRLPSLFHPQPAAASNTAHNATPVAETDANAITAPPTDLDKLVRVYPDATLVSASTEHRHHPNVVEYSATYETHATPEELAAFYRDFAAQVGFKETGGALGLHQFSEAGNPASFSYTAFSESGDLEVVVSARIFETPSWS
jgi:hypothetical protein